MSKITAVLSLLALAILTSLAVYFSFGNKDRPVAFFARDINDASYDCEDKIEARFGKRLISKYYDEYSSRFEADRHQYIIYYRVSAVAGNNGQTDEAKNHMVKCIVWENLGYVSDFQVFDKF